MIALAQLGDRVLHDAARRFGSGAIRLTNPHAAASQASPASIPAGRCRSHGERGFGARNLVPLQVQARLGARQPQGRMG